MKFKNIFLNISYTLTSNFLSLLVSTIVTIFLPKILGVNFYGYFQLYLFYTSYVGFLHFGWCDGIYLKHGGDKYNELDVSEFKGQFYLLSISQMIVTFFMCIIILFSDSSDLFKTTVFFASSLNIVILNIRTFSTFILQATNRMKEYSIIVIIDRIIYVILVILLLLFKVKTFYWYILADIIGKIFSMMLSIYKIKELIFNKNKINWNFIEALDNIKVGINLMFANIASTLIIGIIRFGIQKQWDVATFGKISLTLSISNLMMVFVNAISLAIFPLLKRTNSEEYSNVYLSIRTILMPIVMILLVFYYPLNFLLSKWLPLYSEALKYMAIVFPMVVFECKVSLLSNTYLKVLRKEKSIFIINSASAFLSFLFTIICVFLLNNLVLSMLSIVIILAFRSSVAEIILSKYLDIHIYKEMFWEFCLVIIFIFVSWNFNTVTSIITYSLAVCIYLSFKITDFKLVYKKIKSL